MRVAVAVLTYNQIEYDRRDLFEGTVASLRRTDHPFELFLIDNGSSDGTAEIVSSLGGSCFDGLETSPSAGTNRCAHIAAGSGADLCVVSDDDMQWSSGWLERLVAWWTDAPADLALTGCHLEPDFAWNTMMGVTCYGGVPGLWRSSTGAASWSFRGPEWFGPIDVYATGAPDVFACHRLWAQGRRVAQVDLASHEGLGRSTWGNPTFAQLGWDLGPVHARLSGAGEA